MPASLADSAGWQPARPSQASSLTSVLRDLLHALAVHPNFADAFDARQDVINRLAPDAHQFRTHDAGHEVARKLKDLLRSRAFEAFAKNRRHRSRERLHFRAERHANMCFAMFIDVQINADGVSAVLVFAHVDQIELLTFARLLVLRIIRVGNKRLPPLIFGERFKEIDDLVQLRRVHCRIEFSANSQKWNTGLWPMW
jgi:hypothetical protein